MSTTVLEALQSAQCNFGTVGKMTGVNQNPIFMIAMEQLKNSIAALENDRDAHYVIQESMADDVRV